MGHQAFPCYTRTLLPRFLSFNSAFSQGQLREPSYTCVWNIKTENPREGIFLSAGLQGVIPWINSSRLILVVQQELFAKDPVNAHLYCYLVVFYILVKCPLYSFSQ
jgi:hypothetical protein